MVYKIWLYRVRDLILYNLKTHFYIIFSPVAVVAIYCIFPWNPLQAFPLKTVLVLSVSSVSFVPIIVKTLFPFNIFNLAPSPTWIFSAVPSAEQPVGTIPTFPFACIAIRGVLWVNKYFLAFSLFLINKSWTEFFLVQYHH